MKLVMREEERLQERKYCEEARKSKTSEDFDWLLALRVRGVRVRLPYSRLGTLVS